MFSAIFLHPSTSERGPSLISRYATVVHWATHRRPTATEHSYTSTILRIVYRIVFLYVTVHVQVKISALLKLNISLFCVHLLSKMWRYRADNWQISTSVGPARMQSTRSSLVSLDRPKVNKLSSCYTNSDRVNSCFHCMRLAGAQRRSAFTSWPGMTCLLPLISAMILSDYQSCDIITGNRRAASERLVRRRQQKLARNTHSAIRDDAI